MSNEKKSYSFFLEFEEIQIIKIYIKISLCILKISVTDSQRYKLFLSSKYILQTI